MRQFVVGDIHGAHKALVQCLERSRFDRGKDHLICLGDVCDGWPETKQCIDELLRLRHVTYILGNHDTWFLKWLTTGIVEDLWYKQGGEQTIRSYGGINVPPSHHEFMKQGKRYYLNDDRLFVHAGIDVSRELDEQDDRTLFWERDLVKMAANCIHDGVDKQLTGFKEVYVGHTPIANGRPLQACEIWMMDTGAGWSGVLSMMDIETKAYVTSDTVPSLYPGITGRRAR